VEKHTVRNMECQLNMSRDVRFEVLTAARMTILFFRVVTPCRLISRYQRFGEAYCSIFRASAVGFGLFPFKNYLYVSSVFY
jgi:hypothetical protein